MVRRTIDLTILSLLIISWGQRILPSNAQLCAAAAAAEAPASSLLAKISLPGDIEMQSMQNAEQAAKVRKFIENEIRLNCLGLPSTIGKIIADFNSDFADFESFSENDWEQLRKKSPALVASLGNNTFIYKKDHPHGGKSPVIFEYNCHLKTVRPVTAPEFQHVENFAHHLESGNRAIIWRESGNARAKRWISIRSAERWSKIPAPRQFQPGALTESYSLSGEKIKCTQSVDENRVGSLAFNQRYVVLRRSEQGESDPNVYCLDYSADDKLSKDQQFLHINMHDSQMLGLGYANRRLIFFDCKDKIYLMGNEIEKKCLDLRSNKVEEVLWLDVNEAEKINFGDKWIISNSRFQRQIRVRNSQTGKIVLTLSDLPYENSSVSLSKNGGKYYAAICGRSSGDFKRGISFFNVAPRDDNPVFELLSESHYSHEIEVSRIFSCPHGGLFAYTHGSKNALHPSEMVIVDCIGGEERQKREEVVQKREEVVQRQREREYQEKTRQQAALNRALDERVKAMRERIGLYRQREQEKVCAMSAKAAESLQKMQAAFPNRNFSKTINSRLASLSGIKKDSSKKSNTPGFYRLNRSPNFLQNIWKQGARYET